MNRNTVKDFLTAAGITDEDVLKKTTDSIFAEYGKDIQQKDTSITTLQGQLTEANKKLEGYDPEWKAKADAAEQKLTAQQFEFALERGVDAAKPRNAKAVMALLDRDKLTFAGGEIVGLDKQLTALKASEDTAFLFQSEQKPSAKTGMSHQGGGDVGGGDKNAEANAALRAAFGR